MLFERVYGQHRPWIEGSTFVSLGLHVAALGVVTLSGMRAATEMANALDTGMLFFAPPPTSSAGPVPAERITFTSIEGRGGAADEEGIADGALSRELVGTTPPRGGGIEEGTPVVEEATDVGEYEFGADSIFLASQVDNPAAFDVRSAAPAYPDSLRRNGVEGRVLAQFVVDTTGRVEVASFVLIESSHGRFTESVRQALPGMLFRPAEMNGRKIKQLVQIPFVFRIERVDAAQDTVDVHAR